MNWKKKKNIVVFTAAFVFTMTGIYNSIVINTESSISGDMKFVKRLDEVYGVVTPGRRVAATVQWQKLEEKKVRAVRNIVVQEVKQVAAAPAPTVIDEPAPSPAAAVHEELSLGLIEVANPNKWQNGLTQGQFSGNLETSNGVIQTLSVSLPDGESVSISYAEMTGNVFEYDYNGEVYSGMMYQVDQNSYMVTLTSGPLDGTRLRFSSGDPIDQQEFNQQELAAEYQVMPGDFGHVNHREQEMAAMNHDKMMQNQGSEEQGYEDQGFEAQSYNLEAEHL